MNSNRGIFEPQEGFAPTPPATSPFAVASTGAGSSPFASLPELESPFAAMREDFAPRGGLDPERREPFAQESRSPFSAASLPSFEAPVSAPTPAPFSYVPEAPAPTMPALQPTGGLPLAQSVQVESTESDSRSIRQLELRAIFGVDRELGAEEILQRARALPGIRHVACVSAVEGGVVDAFKRVVAQLGFGSAPVRIFCGNVPVEFIREGKILLAVQNDGTFAPGVRETLMIVARELGRL
ncbi:MAG: hypothetical protein EAZ65_04910 [Verrucomicrobia bacterium]|nr:MAG: hypothetical protein EAZ84_01635 [Verrucomicrobiota bacterium]TAE87471.1 MAG: hypothetical protein EAZ82_07275 [Verrucomicrobiota bacterium]TAF25754.1 MAG: hypothetical protein EAZ71_06260 [Verrucomicrobiota bacterium]TAF41541.1 MAG: hypothetical protein EAZ65_04910 [Verrucomicrobiota bacterium]